MYRDWVKVHSVKCVPCERLNWSLQNLHHKKLGVVVYAVISTLEEYRQVTPWGSLANQAHLLGKISPTSQ